MVLALTCPCRLTRRPTSCNSSWTRVEHAGWLERAPFSCARLFGAPPAAPPAVAQSSNPQAATWARNPKSSSEPAKQHPLQHPSTPPLCPQHGELQLGDPQEHGGPGPARSDGNHGPYFARVLVGLRGSLKNLAEPPHLQGFTPRWALPRGELRRNPPERTRPQRKSQCG